MTGKSFTLNFVAATEAPPPSALLPAPTLKASIEHALRAAQLIDTAAEKFSLLQFAAAVVDEDQSLPKNWTGVLRNQLQREIALERAVDHAYAAYGKTAVAKATTYATKADVRGVEQVLKGVRQRDAKLGRKRPQEIESLIGVVQDKLAAARALRLQRDRWNLRMSVSTAYRRAVRDPLARLGKSRQFLEDIRSLAGPDTTALYSLETELTRVARALAAVKPPADFEEVHSLLTSAVHLADTAVRDRRRAVTTSDVSVAWDASSAAAGAMMVLNRAHEELDRLLKIPELR
jgi:hypothetical protein